MYNFNTNIEKSSIQHYFDGIECDFIMKSSNHNRLGRVLKAQKKILSLSQNKFQSLMPAIEELLNSSEQNKTDDHQKSRHSKEHQAQINHLNEDSLISKANINVEKI